MVSETDADGARANGARPAGRVGRRGRPLGGWAARMSWSLRFVATRRDTWPTALAAFLVRGGIVPLLLPIVVLPSVIGIAQGFGLDAFDIARQPTPWFIAVVAAAIVLAVAWLIAVAWLGGMSDAWLVAAAAGGGEEPPDGALTPTRGSGAVAAPRRSVIFRMAAIRAVCLVPLLAALAYAAVRIYDAAYFELLTPADLATPIVLRVILDASDGVAVLIVVWLLEEGLAALAVRRVLMRHDRAAAALGGALRQVLRRPLSSLATVVLTFGGSVLAIAVPLLVASNAFDWCRVAARTLMPVTLGIGSYATTRDFRPIVVVLAALALVVAWLCALGAAAVTAAWRSAAFTAEVEADAAAE